MSSKLIRRVGAVGAAVTMLTIGAGPALAAAPVSQATARAAQISILGTALDTGQYAVTNDGSGQQATGSNKPALSLLEGQGLVGLGTLAQDATATVVNNDGHSAACSGIAGDGATVAGVGDSNCLSGGDNLTSTQARSTSATCSSPAAPSARPSHRSAR